MAPRNAEKNAKLREEARQRLLHSAMLLFAENGYANTSISQIAQHSGMAKGSVYHYFSGKEALLLEIFDMLEEMAHQFAPEPEATGDPKDSLRLIVDESMRALKEQSGFFRMIAQLALQSDVIEGLAGRIEKMRKQKLNAFLPIFQKLGYTDPEVEMYFLGALLDGMLLGLHSLGEQYPAERIRERIYSMYQL